MPSQRSFQKPSLPSNPGGEVPLLSSQRRGRRNSNPRRLWEGEEDGFLLVFVVLISECISPRAGEAAERGEC